MELACDKRGEGWRLIAAADDQIDTATAFDAALATVSDHRRSKALSFLFEKDRRTSLLAGLLLDELLKEAGLRERDMVYKVSDLGKPTFAEHEDLHFSLAHSSGMAVGALSAKPIGVDVERLPGFPTDIAEPYEWTEMESVGKLLGCGVGTYVDTGTYERPASVTVEHFVLGDYLVCIARETGLPYRADKKRFQGPMSDNETEHLWKSGNR